MRRMGLELTVVSPLPNGGNCVEVAARSGNSLAVRDSKNPDGPVLTFSRAEWRSFTTALKTGALDLS